MTEQGYDHIDARVSALLGTWYTDAPNEATIARIMAKTAVEPASVNINYAESARDFRRLRAMVGSVAAVIILSVGGMFWMRDSAPLPINEPILDQDAFHVFFTTKAQTGIEEEFIK